MAFDDIEITGNGYFMLHDPAATDYRWSPEQFKQGAELWAKIRENMIASCAPRTNKSREEIIAVMEKRVSLTPKSRSVFGLVSHRQTISSFDHRANGEPTDIGLAYVA